MSPPGRSDDGAAPPGAARGGRRPSIGVCRLAFWAGAAAVLGAVFVAYLDPHLMVRLANAAWSCF